MKTRISVLDLSTAEYAGFARFFDIVNGFLIDAVVHRVQFVMICARVQHKQM